MPSILTLPDTSKIAGAVSNGIFLPQDSALVITVRNFVPSLNLKIKGYGIDQSGKRVLISDTFTPTSAGAESSLLIFPVPHGGLFLSACQVYISGTTILVREGDCYISINVQESREDRSANVLLATLACGYLTNSKGISFPVGNTHDMVDGNGKSILIAPVDPAVSTNLSYTIPDHRRFEFLGAQFTIAVQNTSTARELLFYIGSLIVPINVPAAIAVTSRYRLSPYAQNYSRTINSVPEVYNVAPRIFLTAGEIIKTETFTLQAADQYANFKLYGRLWIDVGTSAGAPEQGGKGES